MGYKEAKLSSLPAYKKCTYWWYSIFSKHRRYLFCLLLLSLVLSGCADKRWGDPLAEAEQQTAKELLLSMQAEEKQCLQSFDADMKLFTKSPVGNSAIEGYLLVSAPSFAKIVISNPLGQPVFAFAGDGRRFQMLEPMKKKHIRGTVRSLAVYNKIPPILLQENWFALLTGRLPQHTLTIVESAKDTNTDTLWIQLASHGRSITRGKRYVQINPATRKVVSYLFENEDEELVAEINYDKQQAGNSVCGLQQNVHFSGLPWGAEVTLHLKNIREYNTSQKSDYTLPVPRGFNTQLWP